MSPVIRSLTRLLGVATLALPAIAGAQGAPPPRPDAMRAPRPGISRLIDARRELDLTARQLVQLDSLERQQVAERRQLQQRMEQRRDSLMRQRETLRGADRDSVRAIARRRLEEMRPEMEQARRRDSISMAAAERILTEAQRQRLREMRAEERGRQQGLREARAREMRGQRGMRPMRQPPGDRVGLVRERLSGERQMRERAMADRPMPERPMRRPDDR